MFPLSPTTYLLSMMGVIAAFALVVGVVLIRWLQAQPAGNARIEEVGGWIRKGSFTFLRKQNTILAVFAGIVGLLIALVLPEPIWQGSPVPNLWGLATFVVGTVLSGLSGVIGIHVSTIANRKTAEAAHHGIKPAFLVSFRGGSVMGLAVQSATIIGVAALFGLTGGATYMATFSFGASSMALFAKCGGGIFTKSADIAADLVGKNELGIPEDDPRNPAVIADNVGDNVGDVAGMGADLFDSNVAALAAALTVAAVLSQAVDSMAMVIIYAGLGLLASVIGILAARMTEKSNPTSALNRSTYITTVAYVVLTAASNLVFGFPWRLWFAVIGGLAVGILIGLITDYFTNDERKPVRDAAEASESGGAAFNIQSGFASAAISVFPAIVGIAVAALFSYMIAEPLGGMWYGLFGIGIAAVGMLAPSGIFIANDAFGPVADNARGLAEMGGLGESDLRTLDKLDSAGNTVKAITKGYAIGSAGLTVVALLGAFIAEVNAQALAMGLDGITVLNLVEPRVTFGLLIGAGVPFIFAGMLIQAVKRNSDRMVKDIHRQFRETPGLLEGLPGVVPDYDSCIKIATDGALKKELIRAGLVSILVTLAVGFGAGVLAIGGYLAGQIVTGLPMAMLLSNAGGLWDNAKKYIEAGHFGGKGSAAHVAAVIGDTVGDPFKDTAGPSINTLLAMNSLVSIINIPLFLRFSLL